MKRFIPRRHVRQGVIKEITFDGMLVFISPAFQRWGLEIGHLLIPQRGLIIQPRVAAWPLPWVRYQDEFPSVKGMNTGFVIYALLGNGKVVLLLSQGSGFTATLG